MENILFSKEYLSLYPEKRYCCGCGACMNKCLKHAISMKEDEYGFTYPVIDEILCVKCGLCAKVCRFQNTVECNVPLQTYAAFSKNERQLRLSSSGGIFAAMASLILDHGGVAFGSSMEYKDSKLVPMHIAVSDEENLKKLQGSKYVQSNIGSTYKEAKEQLLRGKMVLFSGTPCQIAGLYGFLGVNYDRLITMDIICHGVPNATFFYNYVHILEKRLKGKIIDFKFRDKTKGCGYNAKAIFLTKKGTVKEIIIPKQISSYYNYFLNSEVYRESCYSCKYASMHRTADITIGDYWGFQNVHPELMKNPEYSLREDKGVSCIIVNTEKGKEYLEKVRSSLNLYLSTYENVAIGNMQLNFPSLKGNNSEKIQELFSMKGYKEVEKYFRKHEGLRIYYYQLMNILPMGLRKIISKAVIKLRN